MFPANISTKSQSTFLQIAVNATDTFFKVMKAEQTITNGVDVLLATRELESFAIKYARIHYAAYENSVISKEHFGESAR